MTRTRWIIFILICLGILGLIIVVNKKDSGGSYAGDASKIITDGPIADHAFGNDQQKVVLIEYGDYQCPGCGAVFPSLKEITEAYKDKLTFVFRHFPLTNKHPNALAAATAAEAAGLQGKYYEYHDLLYENQKAWEAASSSDRGKFFEEYAKQLELNIEQFKTDLTSSDISAKISRDRSTGKNFGVSSTPTLVLNGETVSQDIVFDKDKLKKLIEDKLKEAGL